MAFSAMQALAGAGLMAPQNKSLETNTSSVPVTTPDENNDKKSDSEDLTGVVMREQPGRATNYPSLVELQSIIEEQGEEKAIEIIKPPSIEPLRDFINKRTETIAGLKDLRTRMAKHVLNCKISNTVGNSASIVGGILCFVFPPVGVPVLLAGSATSLGTAITESAIETRLRTKYNEIVKQDSLALKICESNLRDITAWLVTVYSLGMSVTRAGVNLLQLSQAIEAATTLGAWAQLVAQLPSLGNALATGAKTAGTISGKILGISVIISVADLIQTWISKSATLKSIDKDIALLEQQLEELKRVADAYQSM